MEIRLSRLEQSQFMGRQLKVFVLIRRRAWSDRSHLQPPEIALALDVLKALEYFIRSLAGTIARQERKFFVDIIPIGRRLGRSLEIDDAPFQDAAVVEIQCDRRAGR